MPLDPIDRLALSRIRQKALEETQVVAAFLSYTGDSAACVISAKERYDERLSFTIPWLEVKPFGVIAEKLARLFRVKEKELAEAAFIVEGTQFGAAGLQSLSLIVGQYPIVMKEAARTRDVIDDEAGDCLQVSPEDLFGALQSALGFDRVILPEKLGFRDRLLAKAGGIIFTGGKFENVEDPALRAASLGVYYASRALGDSAVGASPPKTDMKDIILDYEAQERIAARERLGVIGWGDEDAGVGVGEGGVVPWTVF